MNSVSIVLPLRNPGGALLPALERLIENTDGDYEVIVVDSGSSDGTELVLEQLGGDVRIVRVDASQSLGAAVNEALLLIKSDVLVLVDVTTPFAPSWLRRVQDAISGSAMALLTDIPISQLFAVRVDAMRKLGVFNETVPDEKIGTDYIERVEFTARRAQKAASFGFANDMLGKEVGESLGHVLLSGREGAKIGQLSPRYAERLRDRNPTVQSPRLQRN